MKKGVPDTQIDQSLSPEKRPRDPGKRMDTALNKAVAALAQRQQGHVTRAQLLRLGMHPEVVKLRVRAGRLIRVYAGVYAVGYVRRDPVARAAAAVLACGSGAVLSHDSAAALWGLRRWPGQIEVTAGTVHRRRGITAHRSITLAPDQVTRHHGIAVTTPARTILDLSGRLTTAQRTRMVNDALVSRYLRDTDLAGTRLGHLVDEHGVSRSTLEDDFRPFLRRFKLPAAQYNVHVNGREVDVYFATERVIVELDSWTYHRTRRAFESDRERDANMLQAGIVTVWITRDRLKNAPSQEAQRLGAILRERRTPGPD